MIIDSSEQGDEGDDVNRIMLQALMSCMTSYSLSLSQNSVCGSLHFVFLFFLFSTCFYISVPVSFPSQPSFHLCTHCILLLNMSIKIPFLFHSIFLAKTQIQWFFFCVIIFFFFYSLFLTKWWYYHLYITLSIM